MIIRKEKNNSNKKNKNCTWGIVHEEGREIIQEWRDKRLHESRARKTYHEFLVYWFSLDTLKSFIQNIINFMVVIQMSLAIVAVYTCQIFNISFDVHVGLFVSPIVFPLAFSINTDFQRREKVLEDLAVFKSSGMVWYFCMREWKQAAGLDMDWITAVHAKLKSLLFHLREYLLTSKIVHRKVILRAMYEDFSDTNQLIEKVRASKLPANTAVISRSVHLLNMMCLSFERLRVIREYRSPRSIRSFNKVFIMFLPILLSPYFVFLGIESSNKWASYYIAVLVAFVFSALQGVQDVLDDPFDGMSEDDIDLDTIDEWTFGSLEPAMKRSFDVGRFKVTVDPCNDPKDVYPPSLRQVPDTTDTLCRNRTNSVRTVPLLRTNTRETAIPKDDYRKLAVLLEGKKGDARITRKSYYRKSTSEKPVDCENGQALGTVFEPPNIIDVNKFEGQSESKAKTVSFDAACYECENSSEQITDSTASFVEERNGSSLSANSDNNIPLAIPNHKRKVSKKHSWVETTNGQGIVSPDDTENSNSHKTVKRFCVKPLQNVTDYLETGTANANSKSNVVSLHGTTEMLDLANKESHTEELSSVFGLKRGEEEDNDFYVENPEVPLLGNDGTVSQCGSDGMQSPVEDINLSVSFENTTSRNNKFKVTSVSNEPRDA